MSTPWHDGYGYYSRELSPTAHDQRDHTGLPGVGGSGDVDLDGYATEEYVDDAIAAIPPTDLDGYATEVYVDDAIDALPDPLTAAEHNSADHTGLPGVGGSGRMLLDSVALHDTYGDDFTGPTLDAKWTRHNAALGDEGFDGSTEGWMSVDLTDMANHVNWSQDTFTSADEFEVVLSATLYYYGSASNIQFGPYIVDSSGDGVGLMIFGGLAQLVVVDNYDYSSGTGISLTLGDDEAWNDVKVWLNLVKKGGVYFGRYSFDGNTWSRYTSQTASGITVAGIGHGRLDESNGNEQKQYRVDRFNVIKHLNRSANRVITPTSGTATYTASSTFSGFPVGNAADGNATGTQWIANGNGDAPTYWQVAWSVAQSINRVMIYQTTGDNFGSGYLEFSDGSRVPIGQSIKTSQWVPVDFPTISTTSLRVASTRGKGTNPSLGEVQAYLAS